MQTKQYRQEVNIFRNEKASPSGTSAYNALNR